MEEILYNAIEAQLQARCPLIKHIGVWNNQVEYIQNAKDYSFSLPACFIEFPISTPTDGVGNNVQVFDPLDITVHIVVEKLDNIDGTMEKNFDAFTTKNQVYAGMQLFKTPGSGVFNRISETPDNDHNNVYHYLQVYRTTWVDQSQSLPVGGRIISPPFTTTITADVVHYPLP